MRYFIITKKMLVAAAAFTVALLSGLIIIASSADSKAVNTSERKLPIYCTEQDEKICSLSFDAAWGNEDTQQLIDILDKYNIKATFFLVGEWVDKYPESVKALSDAGHEIGNHSDTHPHMPTLSREDMAKEINACNDKIEAITGKRPTLFRAPFGDYDDTLIEVLDSQGMYCIQWDCDSLDWKDRSADQIYERVASNAEPGSICLFHNAAKNTPEALPQIIEHLTTDGFKILPVGKHIYKENFSINFEGRQCPIKQQQTSTEEMTSAVTSKNSF
jgi:polysaccharide deacetylase family sporulation protein PdaB